MHDTLCTLTPAQRALILTGADIGEGITPDSSFWIGLGPQGGWFEIRFQSSNILEYDWVAIYANAEDGTDQYKSYYWAIEQRYKDELLNVGNSLRSRFVVTNVPVEATQYNARYMRWNKVKNKYEEIGRTPDFTWSVSI